MSERVPLHATLSHPDPPTPWGLELVRRLLGGDGLGGGGAQRARQSGLLDLEARVLAFRTMSGTMHPSQPFLGTTPPSPSTSITP